MNPIWWLVIRSSLVGIVLAIVAPNTPLWGQMLMYIVAGLPTPRFNKE